ncbi:GDSL-type esterase/lipase family protein [Stenotrophomonas phage B2]|nr:GDSL-type esterase/lipase family protein [Stenotrophomonas phage B2]
MANYDDELNQRMSEAARRATDAAGNFNAVLTEDDETDVMVEGQPVPSMSKRIKQRYQNLPVEVVSRAEAAAERASADAASASESAASASESAASASESAASASAAGKVFDSPDLGVARTAEGDYFSVPSEASGRFLDLYRHSANSTAEYVDSYPNKESVDSAVELASVAARKTSLISIGPAPKRVLALVARDPSTGEAKEVVSAFSDGSVSAPWGKFKKLESPSVPKVSAPVKGFSSVEVAKGLDGVHRAIGGVSDDGKVFKQTRDFGVVKVADAAWEGRISRLEARAEGGGLGSATLGDLVAALNNPLRDVNLVFIGASVEWGLTLPENSASSPRTGRLSDPRDNLASPSYVNLFRRWLGASYLTIPRDATPEPEDAPGATPGGGGSGFYSDPFQSVQFYRSRLVRVFSAGNVEIPHEGESVSGASVRTALKLRPGESLEFFLQGPGFTLWYGQTPQGGNVEVFSGTSLVDSFSYSGGPSFQAQRAIPLPNSAHFVRVRNAGGGPLLLEQISRVKTIRVVNQGIIGSGTGNWAPDSSRGLLIGCLPENPTHAVYGAGANDRAGNVEPKTVWRIKHNVGETLDWLTSKQVKPILKMGGPGVSLDLPENEGLKFSLTQIGRAFRELALEREVSFINPQPRSSLRVVDGTWETGNSNDGVHPNERGHFWRFLGVAEPILQIEQS